MYNRPIANSNIPFSTKELNSLILRIYCEWQLPSLDAN